MVPNLHRQMEAPDPERPGKTIHKPRPRAATCDLCDAEGDRDKPLPRCVYACPHDAAHRMTGDELFKQVEGRLAAVDV
jgi:Fe-S-cluster-containing hydrogenase component 2